MKDSHDKKSYPKEKKTINQNYEQHLSRIIEPKLFKVWRNQKETKPVESISAIWIQLTTEQLPNIFIFTVTSVNSRVCDKMYMLLASILHLSILTLICNLICLSDISVWISLYCFKLSMSKLSLLPHLNFLWSLIISINHITIH